MSIKKEKLFKKQFKLKLAKQKNPKNIDIKVFLGFSLR